MRSRVAAIEGRRPAKFSMAKRNARSLMHEEKMDNLKNYGDNNTVVFPPNSRKPVELRISGAGNTIIVEPGAHLPLVDFSIRGNNNIVTIGSKSVIKGKIYIKGSGCKFVVGEGTQVVGARFTLGMGCDIEIGSRCLFSRNIEIRNTDEHPIFDRTTGDLINCDRSVFIGDNVWVGEGVRVAKGSYIPNGSIIGMSSVVVGKLSEAYSAYAGNPARLLRSNVSWSFT